MRLEEFVRLEPKQVRRDKELMQLFVNFYEAAFSFIPKCVGCSFNGSFKKLVRYANSDKKNIKFDANSYKMEAKTFELKKEYKLKILSYKKDGITYRKYGNKITEDFARELVNAGKTEYFKTLPNNVKAKAIFNDGKTEAIKENIHDIDFKVSNPFESLDYRTELIPKYNYVSEKTGKEAKSRKKEDVIAFLLENEG